jgi:hypothetical protein
VPPNSRAASLRTAASGARRPRAVVGRLPPSAGVTIKTSPPAWWAVQNVRPSCGPDRPPLARLDVAVGKTGKRAAVGHLVMLDVDRGQGLAPDQPTVGTRRPLAGG